MTRYRMDDGSIVDTERASAHWEEETDFDGHNRISRATGSQWHHQTLYRSRKGRYYVEHLSNWQGSRSHVEWVSPEEATRWLLWMEHPLPEDLQQYADEGLTGPLPGENRCQHVNDQCAQQRNGRTDRRGSDLFVRRTRVHVCVVRRW